MKTKHALTQEKLFWKMLEDESPQARLDSELFQSKHHAQAVGFDATANKKAPGYEPGAKQPNTNQRKVT